MLTRYSELVMPQDANVVGTLFGGQMVSWMDISAAKAVHRFLKDTKADTALTRAIDAIEYKEGNQLWVQCSDKVNGYHKSTGVKLDAPLHRLYRLTSDAKKILWIAEYFDTKIYWDIWSGDGKDRKNGEIYMEHENINTVRKVMYSFEFGNYEEAYSYFDKDAIIYNINLPIDKTLTLEEGIESDKTFLNTYEIESIDMRGYVDYLNYDWGDANSALSWWTFRLKRKKDDKKIVLPVHIQDSFNDEGKINRRVLYYSMKLLEN